MALLELKEVLWELTPTCNKNCEYCGSKELKSKKELDKTYLATIIENLLQYPPKSITLTGGEPSISSHFDTSLHKSAW